MVGAGGIGVAPGAEWVDCRAIEKGGFTNEAWFLACGEWMACPTCLMAQNQTVKRHQFFWQTAWGYYGGGRNFMDDVIETCIAGNICPSLLLATRDQNVEMCVLPLTVACLLLQLGAITIDEKISNFSAFGPSVVRQIKPNIVAPGSEIRSASNIADDAYETYSGTSMATPHVAGVVSLLVSSNPDYTYEDITQRLYSGATHTIPSTRRNCGGISEETYPNNHVGHGRLSASASVLK